LHAEEVFMGKEGSNSETPGVFKSKGEKNASVPAKKRLSAERGSLGHMVNKRQKEDAIQKKKNDEVSKRLKSAHVKISRELGKKEKCKGGVAYPGEETPETNGIGWGVILQEKERSPSHQRDGKSELCLLEKRLGHFCFSEVKDREGWEGKGVTVGHEDNLILS